MRQTLENVVRWHLKSQKVKNLPTLEEKAEEIRHQCFVGGGTDTCNLITHYDDLGGEILKMLTHMSAKVEATMDQFVLVIYVGTDDDNILHDLIGPFDDEETAYTYVDTVRERLDQESNRWSFSVWPLTKICERSEP